jgi:hypothetical protein
MSRLEDIEQQVRALPREEFTRFRDWFLKFAADDWDRQIAADLESGRLDELLTEAENDLKAGRFREL